MDFKIALLLSACSVLSNAVPWDDRSETFIKYEDEKPTSADDDEADMVRLSKDVIPAHYDLRMAPNLEDFTFIGKTGITVTAKVATKTIKLHAKELEFTKITVNKDRIQLKFVHELDEKNDLVVINLSEQQFEADTNYLLYFEFKGKLGDKMHGFYKSWYMVNGEKQWLATTQFESNHAREAFPCFDEPVFRATFTVYLARFEHEHAYSNMPTYTTTIADPDVGNRVWEKFEKSPPMSTYMVAFIVSKMHYIADHKNQIRVITNPNVIKYGTFALQQSQRILKNLEEYTNIKYDLGKLDVVAVPDFASGAMENWGLTTYRERYLILDADNCADLQKRESTKVIAHEFAHQWFGDLVTLEWWDYLWLNEGFASYYEYYTPDELEPSWRMNEAFVLECVQSSLFNEIDTQRAMTTAVKKPSQLESIFDVISYGKAASVIRMFEHVVEKKNFKTIIQKYLNNGIKKYNGVVTPSCLFEAFEEVVKESKINLPEKTTITDIFKGWSENIGYPMIKVSRNIATKKVKIEQITYKAKRAEKVLADQTWIVPITYTTKSEQKYSNTQPNVWSVANEPVELSSEVEDGDWVLVNLQQTGYYRVNYDVFGWDRLILQLIDDHEQIPIINRAQLVDDAFSLAYDEHLPYTTPLKLAKYLVKEVDIVPWESAAMNLDILRSTYKDTKYGYAIETYIRNLIKIPYERFGFEIKSTDSLPMKLGKPVISSLAAKVGLTDPRDKALNEYEKNIDNLGKVNPNQRRLVYCLALKHAKNPIEVYDKLWSTYLATDLSYDATVILASLGCTTNKQLLKRTLTYAVDLNEHIRDQDTFIVWRTFFSSLESIDVALEMLHERIPKIDEYSEKVRKNIASLLDSLKKAIENREHLQQVHNLKAKVLALDQSKHAKLTKTVDKIITHANKDIENIEKNGEILYSSLVGIGEIITTTVPPPTAEKPSSSNALFGSIWLHIFAVGCLLLRYNLSFFHFC